MITKRTTLRKAFFAPWHPDVNRIWLYCLAYGQQKYEVAIHTGSAPVNHHHLGATPKHANLPQFAGALHTDVSKGINQLLVQEKYDSPRELWDKREPHYLRLMDAPAQMIGSLYVHLNCVAAGLVARPEYMPGFTFDFDLWKTRYVEVKRPEGFFSEDRPEVLVLEVTPPPLLFEAFDGDIDALVAHMKALEREQIDRLRANQKRAPLGAQRLTRIHPWDEPKTLRETGGRRVETFRYGVRGPERVQLDVEGAREVHRFRRDNHDARIARRDGDLTRVLPYGTYKERVIHGAPVAPVPEPGDAAIAVPGPTLADIEAKLAAEGPQDAAVAGARVDALLEEVHAALQDEAEEVSAHAQDDVGEFRHSAPDRNLIVRHRFDRNRPTAGSGVARVITKRDKRRGRPDAAHNRHGADPPA